VVAYLAAMVTQLFELAAWGRSRRPEDLDGFAIREFALLVGIIAPVALFGGYAVALAWQRWGG
jgi:hypothetical protein